MEFDVWITFSRNLSRLPHKLRADEHPKPFTRAVSAAVARRGGEDRRRPSPAVGLRSVTVRSKNEVVDRPRGCKLQSRVAVGSCTVWASRIAVPPLDPHIWEHSYRQPVAYSCHNPNFDAAPRS